MDAIPRWRNIYHFAKVMTIAFNDGSKFQDLSKVRIILLHRQEFNIITVYSFCNTWSI